MDRHSKKGTKANMAKRRAGKRKARENTIAVYRHMDRKSDEKSLSRVAKRGQVRGNPFGAYMGRMMGMNFGQNLRKSQERG